MANYIRYANSGAKRNQALDPKLVQALGFLEDMGLTAEVFSGGQVTAEEAAKGLGERTGSVRHDHGGAGDMMFFKGNRQLDWANPDDVPIFNELVGKAKAAGITGMGAGKGYMRPGSMHLGFGNPGVWGAGGEGANVAPFLKAAYNGAKPDVINEVLAAGGNAPMLPDPIEVATHPVAGVAPNNPEVAAPAGMDLSTKLGNAIFGEEMAAKLKESFGEGAAPNPMNKGLSMMGKAMGGGSDAQAREHAQPIQSSLPAMEAADAGRIQAAQTMMAQLMNNRRKGRGMMMGG